MSLKDVHWINLRPIERELEQADNVPLEKLIKKMVKSPVNEFDP